jgi:hypothetical protein
MRDWWQRRRSDRDFRDEIEADLHAIYAPARRAARVDPALTLREL